MKLLPVGKLNPGMKIFVAGTLHTTIPSYHFYELSCKSLVKFQKRKPGSGII
jgi:hypothetical protein